MAFELLKSACGKKPFCSFENLPVGEYLVTEFYIAETKKYGVRVHAELEDKIVTLPERFAKKLTVENIAELNQTQKVLCYLGKNPKWRNAVMLDFKELKDLDVNQYYQLTDKF